MRRGEVWWAVWPNDPKRKQRPVLIVSNNFRNSSPSLLDVVVVKLTGVINTNGVRKPVHLGEDLVIRFKKETIIQCGAIYSIEKSSLESLAVVLAADQMAAVDERLKNVLQLH